MATPLAKEMRSKWFNFDTDYLPLNHGSYGTYPTPIRDRQRELQDLVEARSDPFIRYEIPKLLVQSRGIAADYLGVNVDELVLVPNATTAVNTVLRNLVFKPGQVIVYFSFAYPACVKTIQYICETTTARSHCIDVIFPAEDEDIISTFTKVVDELESQGMKARVLMFDMVVTFPGVRLPWERLIRSCRERGVLSLIDGAHGIGHIDLRSLGSVGPDFFTSNCYKWLFTPRPCAVFYVPRRNHTLIHSSIPTSHGFQPSPDQTANRLNSDNTTNFADLFKWVATIDQTPYLCIPEAMHFRKHICGGEERIREYCFDLAHQGGHLLAVGLGTEVLQNSTRSINQCCFTNVRLPLKFDHAPKQDCHGAILSNHDGSQIAKWVMEHSMIDHNTWIPTKFYNGAVWVRLSAQVYLDLDDFRKAAEILAALCAQVMEGRWKSARPTEA